MRLSEREIIDLAEQLSLGINDEDTEKVQKRVTDLLSGIENLDKFQLSKDKTHVSERTWWEPDNSDNIYNAIVHNCSVPPYDNGVLDGQEVAVKDNIAVAGVPMECSSEVMSGFTPRMDATVVTRLLQKGATITAKSNLDELAGTGHACPPTSGPIKNPHDIDRIAGGSSGGSAVLVATNQADVALGTEAGGSIRIPAAFCGVIGLKPTYGLLPLTHILEHAHTLDHVGVIALSIDVLADALEAMAGPDAQDSVTMQAAAEKGYNSSGFRDALKMPLDIKEVTVGVLTEGLGDGVDDAIEDRTLKVIENIEDESGSVREISIDCFDMAQPIFSAISLHELAMHWRAGGAAYRRGDIIDEGYQTALASRSQARCGGLSWQFESRLIAGMALINDTLGRRYTRAQAAREVLTEEVEKALEEVDVLVSPTTPCVAPPIEDVTNQSYNRGRNALLAVLTRCPAITLPNGKVRGLPVGLQLMSEAYTEGELLCVAAAIEDCLLPT